MGTGSETQSPLHRVLGFFDGPASDLAVRSLRSYYARGNHWTGSAFDQLSADTPSDRYTAEDVLAVSMLSVDVPPRAAIALIEDTTVRDLLARIPPTASLWERPELLDKDRPAWRLWEVLDAYSGIGPTIASKLLAAKRPRLIPIFDQHVQAALHPESSQWAFWQAVARDDDAGRLLAVVREAMETAEIPSRVAPLRAIDVVVWMRQHGWTTHESARCDQGCDFTGFDGALTANPQPAEREEVATAATVKANPKCANCNHPFTFHRNGAAHCQVSLCRCEEFVPPQETSEDVSLPLPGDG